MPLAYQYVRFSTRKQADGDSERRQTEMAQRFVRDYNSRPENAGNQLTLADDGMYFDPGVSAKHSKNKHEGALGALLKAIESGEIPKGSWLLVENLDRLSRDMIDKAVTLLFDIVRAGVTVATVGDNHVYDLKSIRSTDANIRASLYFTLAFAESEKKAERYKDMWIAKREALTQGKKIRSIVPSWLKRVDEHSFEVIEERANVVKEIFRLAETGMPQERIAHHLNQQGIPTFKESDRGWKQSNVFHILEARTVFGELHPSITVYDDFGRKYPVKQGDPIQDYYPVIVSEETFMAVQEVRRVSRRKNFGNSGRQPGVANLLTGIAKCAVCGGPMVIRSGTSHGTRKRYLVCDLGKRQKKDSPCDASSWSYEEVESIVLRYMKGVDFAKLVRRAVSGTLSKSAVEKLESEHLSINTEITLLEKRLKRVRDELEIEDDEGEIRELKARRNQYSAEKQKKMTRLTEIDTELQQLRSQATLLEACRDAISELDKLEGLELETARNLIRRAITNSVNTIKICVDWNVVRRLYWRRQEGWSDEVIEAAIAKEGKTVGYAKGVRGMVDKREKSIAIEFKDGTQRYIHGKPLKMVDGGKAKIQRIADAVAIPSSVLNELDDAQVGWQGEISPE